MRTLYIAVGVILALGLAILAGSIAWNNRVQTAAPSEPSDDDTLKEAQSECADQTAVVFSYEGGNLKKKSTGSSYTDHYSARLSECFVVIRRKDVFRPSADSPSYDIRVLSDPYENRDFARFKSVTEFGTTAAVVQQCELRPRAGPAVPCRSAEEWERLVGEFVN